MKHKKPNHKKITKIVKNLVVEMYRCKLTIKEAALTIESLKASMIYNEPLLKELYEDADRKENIKYIG